MLYKNTKRIGIYFGFFLFFFCIFQTIHADTASDIQAKINAAAAQKAALEKEIASYTSQLKDIGKQATSLTSAIKTLDATINKNALSIKLTQNQIDATNLQIQSLSLAIGKNTTVINQDSSAIANLIIQTYEADHASIIETMLAYKDISEFWNEIEGIYQLQNELREKVSETKDNKKSLETNKATSESKKKDLLTLASNLLDQKKVLQVSEAAKTTLLAQTKDKESNYQTILAQKKAQAAALDQELIEFQSQLNLPFDITSFPSAGQKVLQYPLDKIIITQYFGNTEFSKTTTAYNGHGHDGVDFGASIGTPVRAALSGVVAGTGNTDNVCPGASFGQWVFINHPDGLSTMYAHLSLIKVQKGQQVNTGDIIGYSGNTGYTTGPHLHFGLYVTSGSEIASFKSKVCKGTYTMPVADLKAYLNPLDYL